MPPKKVKVVDVTINDNDNDNDAYNDDNTVDQPEVIEANTEELAIATPTIDTIPEQTESESTEEVEVKSIVNEPPEEKKMLG